MTKTPSFESVSTKQQRIAELAKQNPTMAFTGDILTHSPLCDGV